MPPFESREANGIRSRFWGSAFDGYRVSIVSVATVKGDAETVLAKPVLAGLRHHIPHLRRWGDADSSPAADIALTFDMLNEPCLCFTITALADKGNDERLWPSSRLANEVLYLENSTTRYELSVFPDNVASASVSEDGADDVRQQPEARDRNLRFAKLKTDTIRRLRAATSAAAELSEEPDDTTTSVIDGASKADSSEAETLKRSEGDRCRRNDLEPVAPLSVPLPASAVDTIGVVKWKDLQWGPDGLTVNGTYYGISKLVFAPISVKTN
jgi:hypothetical protein